MSRSALLASAGLMLVQAAPALAQVTSKTTANAGSGQATNASAAQPEAREIVVTAARRLDEARASIQPSLGATSYGVDNAQIQALPGGDNQALSQIVLQVPGVAQDGFGQVHVRGDHGNLQYRINGTILPEGLAVFGQTLSPRLIDGFNLLTGALPAQYGLRTAGIMDITTKSGRFADGGDVSLYGGSHGTIEPSAEYGGSSGNTNYFVSGSYRRNDVGIESVDGSSDPLHDRTDQYQAFGFIQHILDPDNRVSFLGGYSNQYFQIPNPRGLHPSGDWSVGNQTDYLSDDLNERQLERTAFGQLSLLHHGGAFTAQVGLYGRYSSLRYRPDITGELLFNGQAQQAYKQDFTAGLQLDASYKLNDSNTIRFGGLISRDRGVSTTTSFVFPVDTTTGAQTGPAFAIPDNGAATEWTYSAYLQDELKLSRTLTFNFGGRFDHYSAYRSESQFSPRANLVWQSGGTTLHLGYARYFSPPPFENVSVTSVALYQNTSAAAASLEDVTPFAERQNYFDAGLEQKFGQHWTLSLDGYLRRSRNLVDEGQFGAPIILTPFNYAKGRVQGVEANLSYQDRNWLVYGNFAVSKAEGKGIVSSQFSFDPAELAYIANHYIHLDHDQTYTASGGISYRFRDGALDGLKLGADALYGSGLRTSTNTVPSVPNGAHLPGYVQINLSGSYKLARPGIELRFDVVNVTDHIYQIRDGAGVGVGAPQFGPRRGFFVGITKSF